jgi:hypothetical protein
MSSDKPRSEPLDLQMVFDNPACNNSKERTLYAIPKPDASVPEPQQRFSLYALR